MKRFTKQEFIGIAAIFLIAFSVTLVNMQAALRRARDAQRRNDIGAISDALNKFQSEFGYFPPADEGKIKMCKGENFDSVMAQIASGKKFDRELFFTGLRPCNWGNDSFADVTDPSYEPYMKNIPSDPNTKDGVSYLYLANEHRYQIYSTLEGGSDEVGYNEGIVARNLPCGNSVCSYGKTFSAPLDKSIEEYEKELLQKGSGAK